jgi:hypothetical protein
VLYEVLLVGALSPDGSAVILPCGVGAPVVSVLFLGSEYPE